MKDFGQWFNDWREVINPAPEPEQVDGSAWMKCCGCGKTETVSIKAYENGDTGWYVEEEVVPDGDYEGVCGGSHFCLP